MIDVVDQDAEVVECDTFDEALALARALVGDGGEVLVHEAHCAIDEDLDGCTCAPVVLAVAVPEAS